MDAGRLYASALTNRRVFRSIVRPLLYLRAGGDAERVHEMAVGFLQKHENMFEDLKDMFDFPNLHLNVIGQDRMPFGTAAGFDKDGEALYLLSFIFGFEEPGTVTLLRREGNPKPRVAVDNARKELYNAQGFPSLGADHFVSNIRKYRERDGKAPLLVSICGIPPSPELMEVAFSELSSLADKIGPYADGLVWDPYSPNTASLRALLTKETFQATAELLRGKIGRKPKLVKMGPYDGAQERSEWLELLQAWMEGGGDGVVCVNTYMVPRAQVPAKSWGYPSAGRSGRFLQEFRDRAVRDARSMFPDSMIIATGGIDSGAEAWKALQAGANLLEGYTPYTFEGLGLLIGIAQELQALLRKEGYKSLSEFIDDRHR